MVINKYLVTLDSAKAESLRITENSTDDPKFNYISNQYCLAHEWLKAIRTCNCDLDETSDKCRHIRKALKKLYGKQIDEMWNNTLTERFQAAYDVYGFKIPFALQERLSS